MQNLNLFRVHYLLIFLEEKNAECVKLSLEELTLYPLYFSICNPINVIYLYIPAEASTFMHQ